MDLKTSSFVNQLYGFTTYPSSAKQEHICKTISAFAASCIVQEDERILDEVLEVINVRIIDEFVLIALIRLFGVYRDVLPNFTRVVNLGSEVLYENGIDINDVLSGFPEYKNGY